MALLAERILVAVETEHGSRHLVRVAAELAVSVDAELQLLHVRSVRSTLQGRPVTPAQREALAVEGRRVLDALAAVAAASGGTPAATHLRLAERIDDALARAQTDLGADLLIVGAGRGRTVGRLLGGGAAGTVRRAPGSVLVVRDPDAVVGADPSGAG